MGALDGITVVDASRVLGGPLCGQILADHGATVIKLEPPQGDETRLWGPPFRNGTAGYFRAVNRNKRGVALDLSRDAGREVLLRLLVGADVLLENFKTGTLEKWGIGYEDLLKTRFPRLVHCRISGFGADGPLGGAPGYDAVAQAMSGLMSINGDQDSGAMRIGTPVVDLATGMNAAIGILAALREREQSGLGQFVEVALYDTGVALLHPHAANYFLNGKAPALLGNAHPNIAPYDKYRTETCEVFLGIGNDRQFAKLCAVIGLPDLAEDGRFAGNEKRSVNRDILNEAIIAALAGKDGHAVCDELLKQGVPAGPVNTVPEVMQHPHTLHREMKVDCDGDSFTGIPAKLSRTPGAIRHGAPDFGQDTRAVLAEAGFTESEVEALVADGIARDGS